MARGSEVTGMDVEVRVLASSSAGNAYYISDGHTPVLIECGIRFHDLQQRLDYQVSTLAACLLSHEHADHARSARDVLRAGVDLYATQGTSDALGLDGHRLRPIRAREQAQIGTWTVLPFETVHDAAEPVGFLLASQTGAKVLYLTDSAYCRYRFRGLTHLLVEANWSRDILQRNVESGSLDPALARRIMRNHMSLERLLEMLKANDLSQVREIHLLHLSDGNSDADLFRRRVMAATGKPVYIALSGGDRQWLE